MYEIYTDGATSNNGKKGAVGGWAYIIVDGGRIIAKDSGRIENATNNICELTAIIEGCKAAATYVNDVCIVYSDSAYCINCYKNKWYEMWQKNGWKTAKRDSVANKELWEKLIPYFKNIKYGFEKVKGHNGNKYNEIVDKMAVEAKTQLKED